MAEAAVSGLRGLAGSFGGVNPGPVALALAFHLANHLLRSVAWRNVLAAAYPARRVPMLSVAVRVRRRRGAECGAARARR
jgi:hypothetical protein